MTQGERPNKFRNATNSRYLKGLFFEVARETKDTVLYTLKDVDHLGYPSLYRLYLECRDPLEYSFANQYLDGWEHWQMLCQCEWFQPYIERWRKELELIIRSEALLRLEADAKSGSKTSVSSNKYLLDGGWKAQPGKGRPSKDDIRREARKIARTTQAEDEDFLRISPYMQEQPDVHQ